MRFHQGCTNAAQLWRELRERGFTGGAGIVRAYVRQLRSGSLGPERRRKKPPTLRQTAWLLVLEASEMKQDEQSYTKALTELSAELARVRELAHEFRRMLREHDGSAFDVWLSSAEASLLGGFARSLRTDLAAVRAAVELPWSNGQTEGQVNRLKLIKRSMYGRAGFDLLRERVLHAA